MGAWITSWLYDLGGVTKFCMTWLPHLNDEANNSTYSTISSHGTNSAHRPYYNYNKG